MTEIERLREQVASLQRAATREVESHRSTKAELRIIVGIAARTAEALCDLEVKYRILKSMTPAGDVSTEGLADMQRRDHA